MAALLIITYDVVDAEKYATYNPGSLEGIMQTLAKHSGELVAAEKDSEYVSGDKRDMTIVMRFPDAAAAKAWHDDPEYVPYRDIRLAATGNITTIVANEVG